MPISNDELKEYIDDIYSHLEYVFAITQRMEEKIKNEEGDIDLFRKLSFYLTPNMNHWLNGMQTGNVKDLRETLERRMKEGTQDSTKKDKKKKK